MDDQRVETYKHIHQVQKLLTVMLGELRGRILSHDASKLESPEAEMFQEFTPKLAGLTYGSPEYTETMLAMGPALAHHYASNRHHPEHHKNGVKDMNLVDLIEMLCDWKAATLRHNNGDIVKSIEINSKRFGFSDELKGILFNTLAIIH